MTSLGEDVRALFDRADPASVQMRADHAPGSMGFQHALTQLELAISALSRAKNDCSVLADEDWELTLDSAIARSVEVYRDMRSKHHAVAFPDGTNTNMRNGIS